ncbi:hypothetical protein M3Y99_01288400 [Aphelenchoides fujianensis]|nr:hypothetical protein M3Y99_01288400 [Aphelenchoides fujianensis]
MLTIVCRSQWPKFQLLVNVTGSGSYYAERNRYNSDLARRVGGGDRSIRGATSLPQRASIPPSCSADLRSDQRGKWSVLLGVGLGTRSGSMKSNNTFAMVGPTSTNAPIRSTLLISGDIVPNYDVVNIDQTRVMIVDFSAIPTVDVSGLEAMCDLFDELAERKIRLLFASVNANIRNRFKVFGGFELVAKHYFFPSVHDAVLCAQQMGGICAPSVHMSISMNGCRDLITLSNATSNHDFIGHHPPSIQTQHSQAGESLSIANPRASVCESRSGDSAPHVVINKS